MLSFYCVIAFFLYTGVNAVCGKDESSSSHELHQKIDSLAQSISSIKTSLSQLKQCMSCSDLSPDENFPQGWTLAFRGTPYINKPVYDAFMTGAGIPEKVQVGCKQVDSRLKCDAHYRNNQIFNNWASIFQVAVVLSERNSVVGYLVFDGKGSDLTNWFSQNRLLRSSWKDLKTSLTNSFSIVGLLDPNRRFFINRDFNGCPNDWGWLIAVDSKGTSCPFLTFSSFPVFLYAKGSTGDNWTTGNVGEADVMAIYVRQK